jgi:hypothetical protein
MHRVIEFDFIVDDRFRASLLADYAEYRASVSGEAWKSSLVLIGSMVEALLVDHLVATEYQKRSGTDPLKMQLGQLIDACIRENALSAKTAALSTVIQGYRNLIHPGRSVRLGEIASKSGAIVAGELLQMIVDELAANKRARYGFTADQIVNKLERDESAISIHKHLLKDVPAHEIERLLLKVIPNRYFELETVGGEFEPEPDRAGQSRLAVCFRSAFGTASEETKEKVTRRFLSILKEEDQYKVFAYETAFFRAADLRYLSSPDGKLVKDHLLSRVQKDLSVELIAAIEGLPVFLESGDLPNLIDSLVKACVSRNLGQLKTAAKRYLFELWNELPPGESKLEAAMVRRLNVWIDHFDRIEKPELAKAVREIKNEIEDIPF